MILSNESTPFGSADFSLISSAGGSRSAENQNTGKRIIEALENTSQEGGSIEVSATGSIINSFAPPQS